jgi:hydrogenase maturation protease
MIRPRILIACIGNIFLGDDGFGVEVARRLAARSLPPETLVKDFGIRGLDLAYALMDSYELTILVDACQRGGIPGSIYLIEPHSIDENTLNANPAGMDAHGMNPMNALRMVKSMGGEVGRIMIVGCEPADLGSIEEGKLGLSETVLAVVDEAIALIESLAWKTLHGQSVAAARPFESAAY